MHTNKETNASEPPLLTIMSRIRFYPLRFRKEGNEYIVWSEGRDEFISIPEIGEQAIRLLQGGETLDSVEKELTRKYKQEVNVHSFVQTLVNVQFVSEINGVSVNNGAKDKVVSLSWLKKEHIAWMVSKPFLSFLGIIFIFSFVTVLVRPQVLPSRSDFFWTSATSLVLVGNIVIGLLIVYLHEVAHLLAARAFGIPGRISFGTRLHNLVMQTDITGIWSLPRKKRIGVYLAGMIFNALFLSFCIFFITYIPLSNTFGQLIKVIILTNILGILFEFHLYMRTDFYFIMLDILRCKNLFRDTTEYIWYIAIRLGNIFRGERKHKTNPLLSLPLHERKSVRIYAWIVTLGSIVSITLFLYYGVPITVQTYLRGITSLQVGIHSWNLWMVFDGFIVLAVEVLFFGLFLKIFLQNHLKKVSFLKHVTLRKVA